MPRPISVTSITQRGNTIALQFGKVGTEFVSINHLKDWIAERNTRENLAAIVAGELLEQDPSGASLLQLNGKTANVVITVR